MEIKLHLSRKPTGKVSQLPSALIEYVNQSIHDGVEYKTIIQHLADKGCPGLNKFNLTRWRRSGYGQWLLAKERRDALLTRTEAAFNQVRTMTATDEALVDRFNDNLVAMQIADTVAAFDPANLKLDGANDFFKLVRVHTQREATAISRDRLEIEAKKLSAYTNRFKSQHEP